MSELPVHQEHYRDEWIRHAERIWGTGFFSPGGPEEVARIVDEKAALVVRYGIGGKE